MLRSTRVVGAIWFLLASTGCLSCAIGAERVPKGAESAVQRGITVQVDANAGTSFASLHERYERNFPSGSRVYYIDQYVVQDGNLAAGYPIESQFRLDRLGLHATNLQSGETTVFSARAIIIRERMCQRRLCYPARNRIRT